MNATRLPPGIDRDDDGNGSTSRSLLLQTLAELSIVQTSLGNVQTQNATIIDENRRASESRTRLHEKLNTMIVDVAIARQIVDRIAPLVDKHEGEHNRSAGDRAGTIRVGKLALTIGAAIVTAIASVLAFLIDLAVRLSSSGTRPH